MRKQPRRVTIIVGTFYPHPHVASVRVTYWAQMLAADGWEVQVICKDHGYRAPQSLFDNNLGPGIKVHFLDRKGRLLSTPEVVTEPIDRGDAGNKMRGAWLIRSGLSRLIVPDMQRIFWFRSRRIIGELVKAHDPAIVVTSSPQHSIHDIGKFIKKRFKCQWLADYRDPHSIDPRFAPAGLGRLVRFWHRDFEKKVYRYADCVTHAIPVHARWARMAFPFARKRCVTLCHPIPRDITPQPVRSVYEHRSIRSVGKIDDSEGLLLADAVAHLVEMNPQVNNLSLHIVGKQPNNVSLLKLGLRDRLVITGRLRHDLAKRQIEQADVLVNAVSSTRQQDVGISSKLYEFAAAGRPIISLNPRRADRFLLKKIPAALTLQNPSTQSLSRAIEESLKPDRATLALQSEQSKAFHLEHGWAAHSEKLLQLLNGLLTGKSS